jgi:hypothetical protein
MKLRVALALLVLASASSAPASGVHFGIVEDSDSNHYYLLGFSTFEVHYEGEISLSADKEAITNMPPGSSLEIRVRRLFTTRMVRVTAGESGKPQIRYWIGDRTGSIEAGRDFLTRHLPEVARVTAVGAAAEARRLLAVGPARLLDAIPGLESETAQEIYLDELGKSRPADPAIGKRAVEVAGHEISSSRRLRRILSEFAVSLPPDPAITSALARACAEISSSSQSAAAIVEIARARGISAGSARDYGYALREIGSSSEKSGAIERLAPLAPDPASIEALAKAAETIASSSETRRALEALAAHPNLSPASLAGIISAGTKIASSSEKSSFLVACARAAAPAPEPRRAYLAVARTIESWSETRRALRASALGCRRGRRRGSPRRRQGNRLELPEGRAAGPGGDSARRQRLRRIYRLRGVDRLVLRKRPRDPRAPGERSIGARTRGRPSWISPNARSRARPNANPFSTPRSRADLTPRPPLPPPRKASARQAQLERG